MGEKLGLTGIDALEAEMRDRLAEANKAHEKTRAYLGAEINSKAELRNRLDIYVTEANRALGEKDASIREYMDICEDLSRKLEASRHRVAELEKTGQYGETKSDQAYQVIGTLASIANCFEHPEVIRALDYFGSDRFDPEFLPFRSPAMIKAEKEQSE